MTCLDQPWLIFQSWGLPLPPLQHLGESTWESGYYCKGREAWLLCRQVLLRRFNRTFRRLPFSDSDFCSTCKASAGGCFDCFEVELANLLPLSNHAIVAVGWPPPPFHLANSGIPRVSKWPCLFRKELALMVRAHRCFISLYCLWMVVVWLKCSS